MSWQWIVSLGLIASYGIAVLAVIHALLRARHPQSALGWVVAIIFLPLAGSLAYFVFGTNRVDSRASKLMAEASARRSDYLLGDWGRHKEQMPALRFSPDGRDVIQVGENRPGTMIRLGGNHIDALFNGDEAYPAMLAAIDRARNEVFLCTYIFQGRIWGEAFADALSRAHGRGVGVRVLVDGLGTFFSFSKPWKRLARAGVPVRRFLPPRLVPPQIYINLRNHRKVLICDELAFTGGMNIADDQVLASPGRRHVQDLHFRCQGPAVGELREAFLMDWTFITGKDDGLPMLFTGRKGAMDCRVVLDGPGTPVDPLQSLLCGVISCARKRVTILTPYFLPPRELLSALTCAASRGVDVRVVLPSDSNHPVVEYAANRPLPILLEGGVKVFRQPPPFAHTKILLIDDLYVCLGSTNLDPRSLSLNYELNMEVFSPELNAALSEYSDAIVRRSHAIALESLTKQALWRRVRDSFFWIFSPYM